MEEVKLDNETGLYPTDYDAVSEALYNESASIFNRIQGQQPPMSGTVAEVANRVPKRPQGVSLQENPTARDNERLPC